MTVTISLEPRCTVVSASILDVCHRMRDANRAPAHFVNLMYVYSKLRSKLSGEMVKPEVFVQLVDLLEKAGFLESWHDEDQCRFIAVTRRGRSEAKKVAILLEKLK